MAVSRVGALLALGAVTEVNGHGYASNPPARNAKSGPKNGYCPHCGNGNGICGDGNQWPSDSNYVNFYDGPVVTWKEGSIVSVEIKITAHHKGHYEFSLCDKVINSGLSNAQACLDKNILQRASAAEAGVNDCQPGDSRSVCQPLDARHPERYYLPPGSGSDTIYLKLPAGVKCDACTLQWRWWSANSCIPAPDYACFKNDLQAAGFNADNWGLGGSCPGGSCDRCGCGEEFRNCIDVSITASGGGVAPSPTTAPSTTTFLPPSTTMTTTAAATPSPSSRCTAVLVNGMSLGATDERCDAVCDLLPAGQWPCSANGPCNCADAPSASPTPMPTPLATPAPTPAPTTASTGGNSQCGACQGCLWTAHNACYKDWNKATCDRYIADGYQWCA